MPPATLRADLAYTLRDDLIGPDSDAPRDAAHAVETLSTPPSHWYLAGFLAPTGQPIEEKEDETADETLDAAVDGPEEGETEAPVARRPVFPSSIGLTVLVHAATKGSPLFPYRGKRSTLRQRRCPHGPCVARLWRRSARRRQHGVQRGSRRAGPPHA